MNSSAFPSFIPIDRTKKKGNGALLYLLDDFLAFVRVERGLSENTVEAYRRDLLELSAWLGDGAFTPSSITVFQLRDFLKGLSEKAKARSTISRKLSSIRVYFAFLRREGEIQANIARSLKIPAKSERLPEVLSREEVNNLLSQPDKGTATGLRDLALLELIYSCGLRVSEALDLTWDTLNLEEEFVRIRGKGNKERLVPFGPKALKLLNEYIAASRPELARGAKVEPWVFLNRNGSKLSRVSAWKSIKKYWLKAGGVRPVSPHTLRHSFATHLIDSGADIRFVQELLGHSDVSTTTKYTHISREQLKREFLKYHPRGK